MLGIGGAGAGPMSATGTPLLKAGASTLKYGEAAKGANLAKMIMSMGMGGKDQKQAPPDTGDGMGGGARVAGILGAPPKGVLEGLVQKRESKRAARASASPKIPDANWKDYMMGALYGLAGAAQTENPFAGIAAGMEQVKGRRQERGLKDYLDRVIKDLPEGARKDQLTGIYHGVKIPERKITPEDMTEILLGRHKARAEQTQAQREKDPTYVVRARQSELELEQLENPEKWAKRPKSVKEWLANRQKADMLARLLGAGGQFTAPGGGVPAPPASAPDAPGPISDFAGGLLGEGEVADPAMLEWLRNHPEFLAR